MHLFVFLLLFSLFFFFFILTCRLEQMWNATLRRRSQFIPTHTCLFFAVVGTRLNISSLQTTWPSQLEVILLNPSTNYTNPFLYSMWHTLLLWKPISTFGMGLCMALLTHPRWNPLSGQNMRRWWQYLLSNICLVSLGSVHLHREIMPLGIAVACASWCHSSICQSGERRMSGHLYTVAVQV